MKDEPSISAVAALIGDPARAAMLTALMDGRALTGSELANLAGVTVQTASGHLSKLAGANLVQGLKRGRHRYFRLSGADVAAVLDGLMGLARRTGAAGLRTGPKDGALRSARVCYDHLAGERGVTMLKGLKRQALLVGGDDLKLTAKGRRFFTAFGIDIAGLEQSRRPLCRVCLDWSERRNHLGGALGGAILRQIVARRWAGRAEGRAMAFTPSGLRRFNAVLVSP